MIEIEKLNKSYGKISKTEVLKNIDIKINDGEVIALLGHNGSGKSTLIKCIVGVLKATSGTVRIGGLDTFKYRKKLILDMGVVFNQKPSFIVDISVYNNLLFFKAIYEIHDEEFENMLTLIDSHIGIKELYDRPYRKLSFGERVKCEITSVLLHSPKYIFLDEPTIGLDYNAKEGLYRLLDYFKKEKSSTIIITTHEVDYIESICDRAVILSHGEVKYDGSVKKVWDSISHTVRVIIKYEKIKDETLGKKILSDADSADKNKMTFTKSCFNSEDKDKYIKEVIEAFAVSEVKTEVASLREVLEDVLKEIKRNN